MKCRFTRRQFVGASVATIAIAQSLFGVTSIAQTVQPSGGNPALPVHTRISPTMGSSAMTGVEINRLNSSKAREIKNNFFITSSPRSRLAIDRAADDPSKRSGMKNSVAV